MRRRDYVKAVGALTAGSAAGLAGCLDDDDGDYPSQSISWIVPFGEGGGTDTYARQLNTAMGEALGESVEIDNRPGAGGLEGTGALHGADPDGYTIGNVNLPSVATAWLVDEPGWEIRELEGFGSFGTYPFTLIVNPEYDHIEDMDDLVDAYQDGEFTQFAMQGIGHSTHVIAFILRDEFGMEWEEVVPYDGGGPTSEAVISDEVSVGIATATSALGPVEGGDVNVVANLASSPTDVFPDLEPVTELGYPEIDFIAETTLTMFAPPETDGEIIETLTEALEEATEDEDALDWAEETGNNIEYGGPEEADSLLDDTIDEIEEAVDLEEIRE
ncbi:Bug family tripartite tricarboxylate transporter substrate binding protein [Natronorarus salvus]|uniref:Bug family tripartite tricarboxylate transporter substrate binding protein n=1 Tax=Natronorarus salvus TaxID=3117733 RepID=UPI002F265C62